MWYHWALTDASAFQTNFKHQLLEAISQDCSGQLISGIWFDTSSTYFEPLIKLAIEQHWHWGCSLNFNNPHSLQIPLQVSSAAIKPVRLFLKFDFPFLHTSDFLHLRQLCQQIKVVLPQAEVTLFWTIINFHPAELTKHLTFLSTLKLNQIVFESKQPNGHFISTLKQNASMFIAHQTALFLKDIPNCVVADEKWVWANYYRSQYICLETHVDDLQTPTKNCLLCSYHQHCQVTVSKRQPWQHLQNPIVSLIPNTIKAIQNGDLGIKMTLFETFFEPSVVQKIASSELIFKDINLESEDLFQKASSILLKNGNASGMEISENFIKKQLAIFAGATLEVGFGTGSFRKLLWENSQIEYFGLDPNQRCYASLQRCYPQHSLFNISLEELILEKMGWQHFFQQILLLRSFNHLSDLDLCFKKLNSLLKSGGRLLIVENYLHASLMHEEASAPPQHKGDAQTRWQHYHNLEPAEIVFLAGEYGFKLVAQCLYEESEANQYVLLFEKCD